MKQINVRIGKKDDPVTTIKTNARKPFICYGEKFIITNYITRDKNDKSIMKIGRHYIATHYNTGLTVNPSHITNNINKLIKKTKQYITGKQDALQNAINGMLKIN